MKANDNIAQKQAEGQEKLSAIRSDLNEFLASDKSAEEKAAVRKAMVTSMRRIATLHGIASVPEILAFDADQAEAKAQAKAEREAAKQAEKQARAAEKRAARQAARDAKKESLKSDETHDALCQYFRPLGFNDGLFYFLPRSSQQVVELSASQLGVPTNLFQLAPEFVWQEIFGDDEGRWFSSSAAGYLINEMAIPHGVYSARNTRGRGVWEDKGRTVVHLGDYMIVDGKETNIADFNSRFTYALGEAIDIDLSKPITAAEGREIRRMIGLSRFDRPASATLLAGFVFTAPICGALEWRPHVYLIGPAGSGKSALFNSVSRLIGSVAVYATGTDSSAAGVRQHLKYDSRPVVFDEFEGRDAAAKSTLSSIMSLARQSSSDYGARALKGTKDGSGTSYVVRSSFFFSSINLNVHDRADEERVTVISLRAGNENAKAAEDARWQERNRLFAKYSHDGTPARLIARAVRMLPTIRECVNIFRSVVLTTPGLGNERTADQLGTLIAGAWCLQHDSVVTEVEAREFVNSQDWTVYTPESLPEGEQLLDIILQARGEDMINGSRPTIGEMIETVAFRIGNDFDMNAMDKSLRRIGIRVIGDDVFVSTNSSKIRDILSDTIWHARYNTILRNISGADAGGSVRFIGRNENTVKLPLSIVLSNEEEPLAAAA